MRNGGSSDSYLVFDIETIPDYSVWSPPVEEAPPLPAPPPDAVAVGANGVSAVTTETKPKTRTRKKAADTGELPTKPGKTPFAPLYAQRPVAIGFLWLGRNLDLKGAGCVGTMRHGDNEKQLLAEWSTFLTQNRPTIVSWNGRGFDMPVITLRSFKHGVEMKWHNKDYRYRYDEDWHLDLCDVMTEYGAVQKTGFKLDAVSKLLGLPGKMGIDGSQVEDMMKAGRAAEVEKYCVSDCVQTAFVLMRYLLMRGRVSLDMYNTGAEGLLRYCRATEGIAELGNAIDANQLLLAAS